MNKLDSMSCIWSLLLGHDVSDKMSIRIEELSGLSPKTLWERDLDSFMEEWEKCLDADTAHRASAQKEVKGKGRAKAAKKKAAYSDDDDEDVRASHASTLTEC